MKKTFVLLTKSRKHSGFCIAGIDLIDGSWVRIVSSETGLSNEIHRGSLLYENGQEADFFDVIEVECIKKVPSYFQPENYLMDNKKWIKLDKSNINETLKIHPFEMHKTIFYDKNHNIEEKTVREIENPSRHSLVIIKATNVSIFVKTWRPGEKKATIHFTNNNNIYKYFSMTDGTENEYIRKDDGVYPLVSDYALIISLGELYDGDKKHYKLVAKMFPLKEAQ